MNASRHLIGHMLNRQLLLPTTRQEDWPVVVDNVPWCPEYLLIVWKGNWLLDCWLVWAEVEFR